MSDTQEPVAWAVAAHNGDYALRLCFDETTAQREVDRRAAVGLRSDYVVVPLYRHPAEPCPYVTGKTTRYCTLTPFTLTDEEREAVRTAMNAFAEDNANPECAAIEATLWGLLERLGGER